MPVFNTAKYSFAAAHQLPFHQGKCKNLHGHNYRLEVTVTGEIREGNRHAKSDHGMVLDYFVMDELVKDLVLDHLDHRNLNDIFPNPTAERIAEWVWLTLAEEFARRGVRLTQVLVGEEDRYETRYVGAMAD